MPAANSSPEVSIIMPTYNRAPYIIETIHSIRQQTFSNWELIIVDDGSDDNTEDLIRQLKDGRIKFYKGGRIGINGKIKNIGLEKSSAELIAFMDSEDLWAVTKLEKQVTALQQYPDAGFSLTGGYNFKKPGEPIDFFYKQKEGTQYGNVLLSFFKSQLSATTPSLMLRKKCFDNIGRFNEDKPFADIDLILSLAKHFKAVILFEPLLYRRLHDTNDSKANWIKGYQHGIEMIRAYEKELPAEVAKQALFRLYMNFGEDYLLHKERKKALIIFFKGWKKKPVSIIPLKKIGKAIILSFKSERQL